MRFVLLIVAVVLLSGCGGQSQPMTPAEEYQESMKWWPSAWGYVVEHFHPLAFPQDDSEPDLELRDALRKLGDEKLKIHREQSLPISCKWYFDRVYKKTPEEVKRACIAEKWGE